MIDFPFATTLDLSPLVSFWRKQAEDPTSRWHALGAAIVEQVEGVPELNGPIDSPERLESHRRLVDLLMSAFLSPSSGRRVAAATAPWALQEFYTTETAAQLDIMALMRQHFMRTYDREEMSVGMTMKAYGVILRDIYGIDFGFEVPFSWVSFRDVESTVPIECPMSGITMRLAVDFDPQFTRVEVVGERPEIDAEEITALAGDPSSLPRLRELMPPEHFAFRGVTMMFAEDVTAEAALTAIRDDLLVKDALTSRQGILHIQDHVRAFMGQSDIELGLIGIESTGDDMEALTSGQVIGRSLLMSDGVAPMCPSRAESVYAQALQATGPFLVADLECCDVHTGYEHHLRLHGIRGLLLLPLHVEGELVGILELGSSKPGGLNAVNVFKLEKLENVFALGLRRSLAEREDRVQSVIKQEYTAIHPVVEWRFREAARQQLADPTAEPEEIVFGGLNPVYGLTDIRGSSDLRNTAITEDLRSQLELARAVIDAAQAVKPQPALGAVQFRIDDYVSQLHPGMATEDESAAIQYLQWSVEPLFDSLARIDESVATAIEAYRDAIDPKLGILYRKRRDFETSVSTVNETVAAVLREEEAEGQALVPHYFELFKTDGVDYNIYVGESLHRNRAHDPLDLNNLRLWQLMTHVKIDRALEANAEHMAVPLKVTHLVLAQHTPLAIRFRRDEHRFDVDGAYNIRYEIVKKRIDKAVVRGTGERLTQPGTLSVAFSRDREAEEYRRHFDYLIRSGYLQGEIEELELEDMQGVFGLRALRVAIAPAEADAGADPAEADDPQDGTPRLILEA